MPAETVSAKFDAVPAAEIGDAVSGSPIPDSFFRMNLAWFHVIFRCDTVEFADDKRLLVVGTDVALVDSDSNGEVAIVSVFQSLGIDCCYANKEQ